MARTVETGSQGARLAGIARCPTSCQKTPIVTPDFCTGGSTTARDESVILNEQTSRNNGKNAAIASNANTNPSAP